MPHLQLAPRLLEAERRSLLLRRGEHARVDELDAERRGQVRAAVAHQRARRRDEHARLLTLQRPRRDVCLERIAVPPVLGGAERSGAECGMAIERHQQVRRIRLGLQDREHPRHHLLCLRQRRLGDCALLWREHALTAQQQAAAGGSEGGLAALEPHTEGREQRRRLEEHGVRLVK